jgi:hypothetical protein
MRARGFNRLFARTRPKSPFPSANRPRRASHRRRRAGLDHTGAQRHHRRLLRLVHSGTVPSPRTEGYPRRQHSNAAVSRYGVAVPFKHSGSHISTSDVSRTRIARAFSAPIVARPTAYKSPRSRTRPPRSAFRSSGKSDSGGMPYIPRS